MTGCGVSEGAAADAGANLGEGHLAWAATIAAGPDAAAAGLAAEGGPDRGCWAWWGKSQPPRTCGGAARRQLHETAVHTYDAQLTVCAPQPLPEEVALDSWLSGDGARVARLPSLGTMPAVPTTDEDTDAADATARGMASELVLAFYGRIPLDSLKLGGNRRLFDQLVDWDPEP
ncbi:maleylpyruvate isomerase N-terminal domain-containing protein [Streptomyces sp. NPDC004232]|uniref:maleylpyruvate isomerase N-terminal domain-containing protein n=1 Tax=Streptomyces sp. NPDC004232 TaxID=3154454 RepID=UPI0033A01119